MPTFLQLCQKVARESGTISGTRPTSVVNQVGRMLEIVNFVKDAWGDIQNRHRSWLWMRTQFPATALTTASTGEYLPASWSITRYRRWITNEPDLVTIYLNSTGVSDERPLIFMSWSEFRATYRVGSQTNNYPVHWSVSPAGEFCLGPKPDATYRINGEYFKSNQTLSANADLPECPADFHDAIAWLALVRLGEFDEDISRLAIADAKSHYKRLMDALRGSQLAEISIESEPLA